MKYTHRIKIMLGCVAVCLLTGCEAKPDNTNINKGMELLEQMDYAGALESFEAALVKDLQIWGLVIMKRRQNAF